MKHPDDAVDTTRRRAVLAGTALVGFASASRLAGCSERSDKAPEIAAVPAAVAATARAAVGRYDGAIAVHGSRLVNGAGVAIQLRGTNIQNHPAAMITGNDDATGGVYGGNDKAHGPDTGVLRAWKMNAIRIGINEASWLGYDCVDTAGAVIHPDRHAAAGSYRAQITAQIAALNAIGCYVILVLAWTSPGRSAPLGQDVMANQDNSIPCWQSIAATYGYPGGSALKRNGGTVDDRSVLFELFNEPYIYGGPGNGWSILMNGGFFARPYDVNAAGKMGLPFGRVYPFACATPSGTFLPGEKVAIGGGVSGQVLCYYLNTTTGLESSGTQFIHLYNLSSSSIAEGATITGTTSGARTVTTSSTSGWFVAGMAQMLAAIRGAGAANPCLLGGLNYDKDLSQWAQYAPADATPPAGYTAGAWTPQIAATWHPYPAVSWVNTATVARGGSGYAVGDTILLPMPESGPSANSVYWQAQLEVTSVSGTAVSEVRVKAFAAGTPGKAGGDTSQYGGHGMVGGAYSNLLLPENPVPQSSSSGGGTGALFNLSFIDPDRGGWPNHAVWASVAELLTKPGVPVVITETGEHTGTGIHGSPWMAALTAWCDANGISLVCYAYTPAWYVAAGYDFNLVTNAAKPSPGYGEFMYDWFTNHP
jgi:hypothetical protein